MKEPFDWRAANLQEAELRKSGDIKGLLNISLDFWNKFGAGHTFESRFPKICFYFGRIKSTDILKEFIDKNSPYISMYIKQDLFEVSILLHIIGLQYPNLSEEEFLSLEQLYCNPKYFDLLEDILFDQQALKKPLKRYNSSLRNIRQSDFSEEFKLEVFDSFIHNENMGHQSQEDYYLYYDRSNNNIVKHESYDEQVDDVEFLIDLNNIDVEKFGDYVLKYLGEDFFRFYSVNPIGNDANFDEVKVYGFNGFAFSTFEERVNEYSKTISQDKIQALKINIAGDWLLEINK